MNVLNPEKTIKIIGKSRVRGYSSFTFFLIFTENYFKVNGYVFEVLH